MYVINKVFTIMINLYVMSIGSNLFLIVSFHSLPVEFFFVQFHLLVLIFFVFSAPAENFPVRVSGNKNMCKWAINHFPNGVVTNLERFMNTNWDSFITPMSLSSQNICVHCELSFIPQIFPPSLLCLFQCVSVYKLHFKWLFVWLNYLTTYR